MYIERFKKGTIESLNHDINYQLEYINYLNYSFNISTAYINQDIG